MYSPKIKPELVKELYRLKHSNENKTPMTRMVNEAVREYINKNKLKKNGAIKCFA